MDAVAGVVNIVRGDTVFNGGNPSRPAIVGGAEDLRGGTAVEGAVDGNQATGLISPATMRVSPVHVSPVHGKFCP